MPQQLGLCGLKRSSCSLNENRKSPNQQKLICPNDLILLRDSSYEPTVMRNEASGCKRKHKANGEAGLFSSPPDSFGRIQVTNQPE
jgi:hypothetical protein